MTVSFHTMVFDVAPTPLGLPPRRFVIEHRCNHCGQLMLTHQLVDHARAHYDPLFPEELPSGDSLAHLPAGGGDRYSRHRG